MVFLRRFRDDFCSARKAKNEQKCGSVCSKSLFCVLNIRAISDTFLSSILGGFGLHFGRFFDAKSEKVVLESESKSKPKKKAIKSHAGNSE